MTRGNVKRGREPLQKRRESAEARKSRREATSPQAQMALLDERLGVGVGAEREREKLRAQIATQTTSTNGVEKKPAKNRGKK
jgi:hypothetical protein